MQPREDVRAAKAAARTQLLAARRTRLQGERAVAATALAQRTSTLPELAGARLVAAYVSVGGEPGTAELLDRLRAAGTTVLLPMLLPDGDLDWAGYDGRQGLQPVRRGLLEPVGPRHGPDALRRVDAVVVPALACDRDGHRLGRGGGSYDRALARLDPEVPVIALLYDDELLPGIPVEGHDRPVGVIVTPSRTLRPGGRSAGPRPDRPGSLDSDGPVAQD